MDRRRRTRRPETPSAQMTLPIDTLLEEPIHKGSLTTRRLSQQRRRREIDTDQLLSTADVTGIIGKHRTTLYRWIKRKWFPAKVVRQGRAVGWLRSEIEQYLTGSAEVPSSDACPARSPTKYPISGRDDSARH